MNINHAGARRGRPKRVLDPSAGSPSPTPPMPSMVMNPGFNSPNLGTPSNYSYNQQVPTNNGMPPDYGFNMPEQNYNPNARNLTPNNYGFNQQPQSYTPSNTMSDGFAGSPFSTLAQPIVANLAMEYGNTLANTGIQQIEKYVPVTALKYYFAVDTDYVMMKLLLLFFPFTHKDWSIRYEQNSPLQPRYEKNAPDMYIPTMAFLTYVVMAGLALGTQEKFTPEQLGITASSALAWGIIELLVHIITLYVTNLETSLKYLDLLAYCSYKYVGINAALLTSLLFKRFGYYIILLYYSITLAFFLVRSLNLRMIPEGHYTAIGNKRRLYFILFIAGIQPVLMWWLSYHLV